MLNAGGRSPFMTSTSLSREEFATALQSGHGRALLYVLKCGIDGVADLVLEACLHDQAYDPQSEGSRAKWLFDMFYNTQEYRRFSNAILSALASENETRDLQQLCELASHMAAKGDVGAHDALRSRVLSHALGSEDIWVGARELVSLDGNPAVVELARRYGTRLLLDSEEYCPGLDELFDGNIPLEVRKNLQELSVTDHKVKAYWEYVLQAEANWTPDLNSQEKIRERTRQRLSLQKILDDAVATSGEYPGPYTSFGKAATPEELMIIFQHLLTASSEKVAIRLLWVFRRTQVPKLDPKLWEFAASTNEDLKAAAIEVLAQNSDPSIGKFARNILSNGGFNEKNPEVLDLFIHNFEPGDGKLISFTVQQIKTIPDYAHEIGWSILNICDKNHSPELTPALNWVYENMPCTTCRERAVRHMLQLGSIRSEILEECRYDANDVIQQMVSVFDNPQLIPTE